MNRDTKDVLAAVGALRIAVDLLAEQGIPLMQLLELVQGIWDVRNPPEPCDCGACTLSQRG